MAELTATVTRIEELESKAGKTYWKITLKGKEYTAFGEEVVDGLHEGLTIRADVAEKKEGKFTNRYFNGYEVANESLGTSAPKATPAKGGAPAQTITPDAWEAKDRRIAMEASNKATAEYMKSVKDPEQVTVKNWQIAARIVYRDILWAGEGKELFTEKPRAPKPIEPPPPDDDSPPF